uniref:2-aminoethanethiol dioxygenase n=1 Tax=Clastoptera arizonana TaxID=38151 RepID=A0A1B6CV59_9HEMI
MNSIPSTIELVKRLALLTFSKKKVQNKTFEENFAKLKHYVKILTGDDVGLDMPLFLKYTGFEQEPTSIRLTNPAPVTYIEIFDDPEVTIGIFILKAGSKLPLHDHPIMFGMLKVLFGDIRISSYSHVPLNNSEAGDITPNDINLSNNNRASLICHREPDIILDIESEPCTLTPKQGNIHEICPINGPAAFIDILSPPYQSEIPGFGMRPCRYFKDCGNVDNITKNLRKLMRIPTPKDYWSDVAPYTGPKLS